MKFPPLESKPILPSLNFLDNFPNNLQWINIVLAGKSQLLSTRLQSGLLKACLEPMFEIEKGISFRQIENSDPQRARSTDFYSIQTIQNKTKQTTNQTKTKANKVEKFSVGNQT